MKNSSEIWETATVVTAADVLDSVNDEYHTGLAKPVVYVPLYGVGGGGAPGI